MHGRDATRTKPSEPELMPAVDSASNVNEISDTERRCDDICRFVVRFDSMVSTGTADITDIRVHVAESNMEFANLDNLQD